MALEQRETTRWEKRVGILILGLTGNAMIVNGYDYVVYPFLIANFGLVQGWFYACTGSIILCLLSLWFYDATKQDWFGLEAVKLLRDGPAAGKIRQFFQRIANRGDALAFVVLSLRGDAFLTTVYMRRGSDYQMSSRDWKIFWGSLFLSEIFWGLFIFGAIEVFRTFLVP